jgi:hypothetical protein
MDLSGRRLEEGNNKSPIKPFPCCKWGNFPPNENCFPSQHQNITFATNFYTWKQLLQKD